MRQDISSYVQDFRGVLGWNGFTQSYHSIVRPAVEVELYIKEHPLPQRKVRFSEVSTIQMIDPYSKLDTGMCAIFEMAPELLSVSLTGFIITPFASNVWQISGKNGEPLYTPDMSYAELIQYYIEGYMNLSSVGVPQRLDPDYYITPYGQRYNSPLITSFEFSSTTNPRKQQFTMQLYLER